MTKPTYEPPPHDEALIAEVKAYMETSHLSQTQFAAFVGIAHSTLRHWLGRHAPGQSDARTCRLVRAFLEANPITIAAEMQGRFYNTENVATMRHWFTHCLGEQKAVAAWCACTAAPVDRKPSSPSSSSRS